MAKNAKNICRNTKFIRKYNNMGIENVTVLPNFKN